MCFTETPAHGKTDGKGKSKPNETQRTRIYFRKPRGASSRESQNWRDADNRLRVRCVFCQARNDGGRGVIANQTTKEQKQMNYPETPGYKRGGTSKAAAGSMRQKSPTLRQQVLDVLFHQDLTADECAAEVGKSVLSIRPRLTELLALGKIAETDLLRFNSSGKKATVWRAV